MRITVSKAPGQSSHLDPESHMCLGDAFQRVSQMHSMSKTGAIRNNVTGEVLDPKCNTLTGTVNGNMISFDIQRDIMYMSTFMMHKKRAHQTMINHIDGDPSNHAPWNLRWMSKEENELAKFT